MKSKLDAVGQQTADLWRFLKLAEKGHIFKGSVYLSNGAEHDIGKYISEHLLPIGYQLGVAFFTPP